VTWYVRISSGGGFDPYSEWAADGAAQPHRHPNHASVRWYGRSSQGTSFIPVWTWSSDAGDEGDCFP